MKIIKNYKSSFILLAGMVIGAIVGLILGPKVSVLQPIATLFLNLLYTIIVPLIFTTLVAAISKMQSGARLGKIMATMFGLFIATGVVAAVYMLVINLIFDPAKGANFTLAKHFDPGKTNFDFVSLLTVNDFSLLWSRQNIVAMIIFALAVGIATSRLGKKAELVSNFFEQLSQVMVKIVGYIMVVAPIGLGALFATIVGTNGSQVVGPILRAVVILIGAEIIYYFLDNSLMSFIGAGMSGLKRFWKNILPATLTALGTSSSAASMTTNLLAGKNVGLDEDINNLTIPLGANLHKDGGVLTHITKIVLVASIFHVNMLTVPHLLLAILIAVFAASVEGAIPAGGYTAEIIIVSAFGFPVVSIPIMILLGTITDPTSTVINVTGDVGVGMILQRIFGKKEIA